MAASQKIIEGYQRTGVWHGGLRNWQEYKGITRPGGTAANLQALQNFPSTGPASPPGGTAGLGDPGAPPVGYDPGVGTATNLALLQNYPSTPGPPAGAASILAGGGSSYQLPVGGGAGVPSGGGGRRPGGTTGITSGDRVVGSAGPRGFDYGGSADGAGAGGGAAVAREGRLNRAFQAGQAGLKRTFQAGQADEQRAFQAGQAASQREHESQLPREAFERKTTFLEPYLQQLYGDGTATPDGALPEPGTPSESEQILIDAQREAGERELNQLQDILSGAGVLSSGSLNRYATQILGATRAGVARTTAGFAESRLTRQHQKDLAKRQQLNQLLTSVLG